MAFDLTLRQLRYFVAAAQTGQFSMAAANEHVSQSAITNAVLALESALGTKLFERLPQGVALTPDGQDFHNHARRVLDAARDAMHMPPFRAHDMRGVARIAASYTVLGYFCRNCSRAFVRRIRSSISICVTWSGRKSKKQSRMAMSISAWCCYRICSVRIVSTARS